jgi:hypothetical protein
MNVNLGGHRQPVNAQKNPGRRAVDDESKCPVSGKRKYATEGEALSTAAHQIATTQAPKDLRAYLCSWCDAWHLTKNAAKTRKGRG